MAVDSETGISAAMRSVRLSEAAAMASSRGNDCGRERA